jgi:membrane-anchored protein YejM (alkaline phosphatase superfamily)
VENIAVAFKNYKPYFQYTWATRIAHNDFNGLALGDEILLDSLKFLSSNGLLNNTAFFIISDHGSRLGEITETKQGRIEDRLPVHYIVLPPWFKTKYPISWRNLRSNEDKLTSAFDLHKTLLQFMDLRKLKEIETPASECWKVNNWGTVGRQIVQF